MSKPADPYKFKSVTNFSAINANYIKAYYIKTVLPFLFALEKVYL